MQCGREERDDELRNVNRAVAVIARSLALGIEDHGATGGGSHAIDMELGLDLRRMSLCDLLDRGVRSTADDDRGVVDRHGR
jgi:hypothetical protein